MIHYILLRVWLTLLVSAAFAWFYYGPLNMADISDDSEAPPPLRTINRWYENTIMFLVLLATVTGLPVTVALIWTWPR